MKEIAKPKRWAGERRRSHQMKNDREDSESR